MVGKRQALWAILAVTLVTGFGGIFQLTTQAADTPKRPGARLKQLQAARQARLERQKAARQDDKAEQPEAADQPAAPQANDFRLTLSPSQFSAAVEQIDRLIDADLAKHSIQSNAKASDEIFLRRAYLSITGTIPNYDQARAFLESDDANKRTKLIDELLSSPGYVSHHFNFWADLLRITTRLTPQATGSTYMAWVKDALAANIPYDQFVYELLASEGKLSDNGATGYYVRDSGMPLDNASNTVRLFLGTSIGCAQCHDHPFDKWTQYEFYEMAAYTIGMQTRIRDDSMRALQARAREEKLDPNVQAALRRMLASASYGVQESKRSLRLPDDYKYDDAKPKEVVLPHTMFGEKAEPSPGQTAREAYAAWVTSPENPRFTLVIANRLWKKAFGTGLIEPVDEITDDTKPSNPELMAYLENLMRELDYDVKAYLRVLYNTKAWQRMATRTETALEDTYRFPGPQLRRMTAEQMWDSVLTISMPNPDGRKGADRYRGNIVAELNLDEKSPDEIIALAKEFTTNRRELQKRLTEQALNDESQAEYRGFPRDFVRASELASPAPAGHFLRQFGQSDRELIDTASTEPSVTQALTLLNGLVEKTLLGNPKSVLRKNLADAKEPVQKIKVIFLSILGRMPTQAELAAANREVRDSGEKGYGNIVWALLNTREFMFIQ